MAAVVARRGARHAASGRASGRAANLATALRKKVVMDSQLPVDDVRIDWCEKKSSSPTPVAGLSLATLTTMNQRPRLR